VRELRVGLDVSPLVQTAAGTSRHIVHLAAGLAAVDGVTLRPYRFGGSGKVVAGIRDTGWYLAALPVGARLDSVDLLHCPTQRAPTRSPVPLVVTVHDLAVLRHPLAFNRWTRQYTRVMLPRVVRRADRLIAVSEFTASELVAVLGAPRAKIRVVPNGVGDPFSAGGPAAEGDYVLCVSTLEPRKNLSRLVEGFEQAALGCELWIVGARGWGDVRLGGARVRWLGRVPDDRLAQLYRGARCLAYVSLYEGFGLPVLEAIACGTPVVAADIPALREVAGAAAIFVDPLDAVSIASGLREASRRRDELAPAGRERARGFTWAETARRTAEVYREAVA
jgi:glycosyltransferase involved in cell wall biosynthesis